MDSTPRAESVENLLEIGRGLVAAKKALPHGEFLDWIEQEFHWHRSTAWRLMNAYENHITDVKQLWGHDPNDAPAQHLLAPKKNGGFQHRCFLQ